MRKNKQNKQECAFWLWICSIIGVLFITFTVLLACATLKGNNKESEAFLRPVAEVSSRHGGVDLADRFYPPVLRSLVVNPQSKSNYFDFVLDEGNKGFSHQEQLDPITRKLIQYFFLGITLPSQDFWVNLNPVQPDKIASPHLTATDIGKVLLEVDLNLKKDAARFTDPRTSLGQEYWARLKDNLTARGVQSLHRLPLSRLWIVPDEAVMEEVGPNRVNIVNARLKVCLESEYLKGQAGGIIPVAAQDSQERLIEDCAISAMKEVIVPVIEHDVNYSARYAPIRQVYYSLILAEYFKQKYWGKKSIYDYYINQCRLTGLYSRMPWSKRDFFNSYVQSYEKGEYSFFQQEYDPYQLSTAKRHYFSGGIRVDLVDGFRESFNKRAQTESSPVVDIADMVEDLSEGHWYVKAITDETNAVEIRDIKLTKAPSPEQAESVSSPVKETDEIVLESATLNQTLQFQLALMNNRLKKIEVQLGQSQGGEVKRNLEKEKSKLMQQKAQLMRRGGQLFRWQNALSSPVNGSIALEGEQRLSQINDILEAIDMELNGQASGRLPQIFTISDYHGQADLFLNYVADVIGQLTAREVTLSCKDFPAKSIKQQLAEQGVEDIERLGAIFFLMGDCLDRGPYGIKCFLTARELVDLGLALYITGNHDFWALANLQGFHLPIYENYNFYGHEKSARLVREHWDDADIAGDRIGWWTARLAEYNAAQAQLSKKMFGGSLKEIREEFKKFYLENIKNSMKEGEEKTLWEDLIGYYFGETDVYTGLNAPGNMSVLWWEQGLNALDAVIQGYAGRSPPYDASMLRKLRNYSEEAHRAVEDNLNAKLSEGKWYWQVFNDINHQAYDSPEWWFKDWSSHKGWGTSVIQELNEMEGREVWNQANYIKNPYLQEMAHFYRKAFGLSLKDAYGNRYTHGWLPVDLETGKVSFTYKQTSYQDEDVWRGLEILEEDVRDFNIPFFELSEALTIINSWYADKTTRIKPPHLQRYVYDVGLEKIYNQLGIKVWFTGHNPLNSLAKKGIGFKVQQGDYTHITVDKGMSYAKFKDLGGYVVVDAEGIRLRGYEDLNFDKVVHNPNTVKLAKNHLNEWLIEQPAHSKDAVPGVWDNPHLEKESFLRIVKTQLEKEKADISSPVGAAKKYTPAEVRDVFEKKAQYYDLDEVPIVIETIEHVFDTLVEIKEKSILDLGTGKGLVVKNAIKHGPKELVAVDISGNMLKYAEQNIAEMNSSGTKVEFIEGDMTRLTELMEQRYGGLKKFDIVTMAHSIDFYSQENKASILSQAWELLEDDGKLIIVYRTSDLGDGASTFRTPTKLESIKRYEALLKSLGIDDIQSYTIVDDREEWDSDNVIIKASKVDSLPLGGVDLTRIQFKVVFYEE